MMITCSQLEKTYHVGQVAIEALRGVSLEIEEGSFVSIIGKSGAGKSTLLYQLSLLDTPTKGSVTLNNVDTSGFSHIDRTTFRLQNLGYIFQDYALLPELSATDNVIVPLLAQGESMQDAIGRAQEVLARLGLGERLDNLPTQLSGGEQQRVSIARAIVHQPLILFADEPTASLDSATSKIIIDYLKELNEAGQTIVMVTHEKEYSEQTHRIVEMSDGQIISDTRV